jgi:hypothetical protein
MVMFSFCSIRVKRRSGPNRIFLVASQPASAAVRFIALVALWMSGNYFRG